MNEIRYESFLFRTYKKVWKEGEWKGKKVKWLGDETIENRNILSLQELREAREDFEKIIKCPGVLLKENFGDWSVEYEKDGEIYYTYIMGFVAYNQREGGMKLTDL